MLNFNIAQHTTQTMSDVWRDLERKQAMRSLVEPDGTEFVVARLSDGIVIGRFGSVADAEAVIKRAHASKKATLTLA
jgi:hypothetical protein